MPREALKTSASKPGAIGVPEFGLKALARATTSCGIGNIGRRDLFITSSAA
jgi:hypothetical protein